MNKEQIYNLQLIDGLRSQVGSKTVYYKTVHLRETTVEDECTAVQLAERVMPINGKPALIVSDEIYRIALTMRHIVKFSCAGLDDIGSDLLNMEMIGRLSPYDLQRIEERCMLVTLAAQLRYGLIDQTEFDRVLTLDNSEGKTPAPRFAGQAEAVGNTGAQHQSGPAMLADYATPDTQEPAAVVGKADH